MKPKLILYNPRSNASRKKILPMSLLAVGAVLEGKYDYVIVDGNVEQDAMGALRERIRAGRNLLAVTVMPGPQLSEAVPLCRNLKEEFPHLKIVWGGYFPTQHADVCLNSEYVDFAIIGHGEFVFLELLDALSNKAGYSEIAGLAYQSETGEVVQNPNAPIPHPEQLPDFPFGRVDIQQYVRPTFLGSRTMPYHSSYGCPFFCNFCSVVNMVNGRWLPQSAERIEHIARKYVDAWGVNAIEFYDNNFFTQQARVAEFAERIMPLNISWWGESRIDTLLMYSERTWQLMRDAGLKMVFMGAESGSLETLKRMDKGGTMSPDKTLAMAAKMEEYGIVPEFSFVLGNPPDPEADMFETIEFIRRVKEVNPRSEIIMYNYTPVPLSGDLYDSAKAQGFRFPDTLEEWINEDWAEFSQRHGSQMPWLQERSQRYIRNFERVLNAYYPTSTNVRLKGRWRRLLRSTAAWRYRLRLYDYPYELAALQKVIHYQRPETSGF